MLLMHPEFRCCRDSSSALLLPGIVKCNTEKFFLQKKKKGLNIKLLRHVETWKKFDKLNVCANLCVVCEEQAEELMLEQLRPRARIIS